MSSKWKLRLISHAVMEMGRIGLGEGRKSIIPPPLGDNELKELANAEAGKSKIGKGGAKGKGRVGWSINGTELGRYMELPGPGDDSVRSFC